MERALRVLDGAILVLCSVGGVQSQSITVDRQMRRYAVPRLCFINKCDRTGADPWKVLKQVREKLRLNAAAVHVPIGLEENHAGVVDLVRNEAVTFHGPNGNDIKIEPVPENMKALVAEKRRELIEAVAEVDDELGELFLMGEEPTTEQLKAAIRRATVAREFAPLFMGSAFKNKGVQLLLDGVVDYLPAPHEVSNVALDLNDEEKPVELAADPKAPLVGLAFKLEEGASGSSRTCASIRAPSPRVAASSTPPRARSLRCRAWCACTARRWRTCPRPRRERSWRCSGWTASPATLSPAAM